MIIAGEIETNEEAKFITFIAKCIVVGERSKYLAQKVRL